MKKEEKVRLPYVPTYGEEVANTVSHAVMLPATTSSCSTCGTAERLPKARRSPVCATAISVSEPTV